MKQILKLTTFFCFALMPYLTFSQFNNNKGSMAIATSSHMEEIASNMPMVFKDANDKDEHLPVFSFSQDLYQFHLNFKKTGAKFSAVDFILYMDIDNDNKMILNEPALRFSWNGNDEKFSVNIYNYIPSAENGDVLVAHTDMPGKLLYRTFIENSGEVSDDGETIDVSIPFMHITRTTGTVILDQLQFDEKFKFHVSSTNEILDRNTRLISDSFNVQSASKITPFILYNFTVAKNNNKNYLEWAITKNEEAERFEIEKSSNGKNFSTAALVFTSEKAGNEMYKFYELSVKGKVFYRLKMYDKNLKVEYSQILSLKN